MSAPLLLAWANLDFGRTAIAHERDLHDMAAAGADVIACCELRQRIDLPGFRRYSPNRLDGSAGSEAIYVRNGLVMHRPHSKLEFLDRAGQMIGFRRILDVTVHHPDVGQVTVVATHVPPRRMQHALLAPSVLRIQRRLRRLNTTGRNRWAMCADWNFPLVRDPASLGTTFRAKWYGPARAAHISGIDGFAVSPALEAACHVHTTNVPHPDRTDGHPTVYLRLTAKEK